MNLTIMPGAALDDAKQIEEIIGKIDISMKALDGEIKKYIPEGVETKWSVELKETWEHFYNNTIQNAMDAMLQSANSLKRAVEAAEKYNE